MGKGGAWAILKLPDSHEEGGRRESGCDLGRGSVSGGGEGGCPPVEIN